jgi:hypothetical protein
MPSLLQNLGLIQMPLARMMCQTVKAGPTARTKFGG